MAINYIDVAVACEILVKQGDAPTQRKVQAITGGSFSRVLPLLNEWKEQQKLASQVEGDISEGLRKAILAEYAQLNNQVIIQLKGALEREKASLTDAQDILLSQELEISTLKGDIAIFKKESETRAIEHEKALAAAHARIQDFEAREQQFLKQIDLLRQQITQGEIMVAKAETQAQEAVKYLNVALKNNEQSNKSVKKTDNKGR